MICSQGKHGKIDRMGVLFCIFMFTAFGCGGKSPSPETATVYPETKFLTAQGSGKSDLDARQQALAQLGAIFEARVSSQFDSQTRSTLSQAQKEEFRTEVDARVQVSSGVRLEGLRIGRSWKDEKTGDYHALAVLDKRDAGRNWSDRMALLDAQIQGELALLDRTAGRLSRMAALNRIMALATDRQSLAGRLRVVDFPVMELSDLDLGQTMAERAALMGELQFFIAVQGEYGEEVSGGLAQALTAKGLAVAADPEKAGARILGDVVLTDLNLDHPNAKFVRAQASILVFETEPQTLFVQVNDSLRKGHQDREEARYRAVKSISEVVAGQLLKALGVE